MLAQKRKEVELFSLSFMDCICCGFGAILLIFILTTGQKTTYDQRDLTELRERIGRLEREINRDKEEIERLARSISVTELDLQSLREQNSQAQQGISQREKELQLLLQNLSTLKDTLAKLMETQKALPTQEEPPPIAIPNVDRRQYLTGFKLEGDFIVFLVRASGSMLDETIDTAAARLEDPDFKKREAPKWQHTLRALEWMIATLDPESHFQILLFNEETAPVVPNRPDDWFSPQDRQAMAEVLASLHSVVPRGAANLERAMTAVRYLQRLPDSIVLITDGLPTRSDSVLGEGEIGEEQRIRFLRAAIQQLPPRIPVSTILLPLNGDPAAPALYWQLANATRGALVSPSKTWPDT